MSWIRPQPSPLWSWLARPFIYLGRRMYFFGLRLKGIPVHSLRIGELLATTERKREDVPSAYTYGPAAVWSFPYDDLPEGHLPVIRKVGNT